MMERGLGAIPDYDRDVGLDLKHRPIVRLVGSVRPATSVDYTAIFGEPFDQENTNSCTGNSASKSLAMRARFVGRPLHDDPSRNGLYGVGRKVDAPYRALEDFGARPTSLWIGAEEYGICFEKDWPLFGPDVLQPDGSTVPQVNADPPLDVFTTGQANLVTDRFRIAPGNGAADEIGMALARGIFPTFTMPVDRPFQRMGPGDPPFDGITGSDLGLHSQLFIGRLVVGDVPVFLVGSSWGRGHGRNGVVLVTERFVNSGAVTDIIAPTVIPGD